MCLLKPHTLSYWFLIPIVCSWPCRDLQQRALHDCMHWVQSDGIFPWLMFYLRVVYVFMTVPVTKLLSNLYYGFGWSCGAQDTGCSTLHTSLSLWVTNNASLCSGPRWWYAHCSRERDTGGQSALHLPAPFLVWFYHPWDLKQMVLSSPHTS